MSIQLSRQQLDDAVVRQIVSATQAEQLWKLWQTNPAVGIEAARFQFSHILYYFGGLLAMGAMSVFMTMGWNRYGPWALTAIAVCYGFLVWKVGDWLLRDKQQSIPAGILFALVIVLVPLAMYGFFLGMGWWPEDTHFRDYHAYSRWYWLFLELGTLAAGCLLFWCYRLPFILMPLAVTLWYFSMDAAGWLILGMHSSPDSYSFYSGAEWEFRKWFSVAFGLAQLVFAGLVDYRSRRGPDYAFWLYLFGLIAFWGGLTSLNSDSELGKFIYCLINVGLILAGAVLGRRMFAVFGGIGVYAYLGHLAGRVFRDSMMFPLALSVLGLVIIALGVWWHKHGEALGNQLRQHLPQSLREWLA